MSKNSDQITSSMDFIEAHVVFENAAFAYRNTSLFNSLPIHEEWFLNEYLKRGLSFIESYCSSDENRNELMRVASLFSQKLETLDEFELFGEIPRKYLDNSESLANRTLFPEPVERESVTTLFIIGNGFDLDHDMPTGFSHFKSYIETCAEYISEGLLAISGYSDVKPEDMWFEFERYMVNHPGFSGELYFSQQRGDSRWKAKNTSTEKMAKNPGNTHQSLKSKPSQCLSEIFLISQAKRNVQNT